MNRTLGELRLLTRYDREALIAEAHPPDRPPDPGFASFDVWRFTRHAQEWHYAGNGSCRLRGFVDGHMAHPWSLDPDAPPPGPDSTVVPILVDEAGCASGDRATGRIRTPHIVYREQTVEIAITIDPAPGPQDCPSNPPTPYVVQLSEALRDRQLLDASLEPVAPPRPVTTLPGPTPGKR